MTTEEQAKCVHADHGLEACAEHIYVSVEGVNNPANNKGMWPFHCILVKDHTGPHKACSWQTCDLVNWDITTLYAERDASRKDMN